MCSRWRTCSIRSRRTANVCIPCKNSSGYTS
nr:MAG TPA: hypothetical protein [Caudoviricetes sp.]